jgi:hypothetical protein
LDRLKSLIVAPLVVQPGDMMIFKCTIVDFSSTLGIRLVFKCYNPPTAHSGRCLDFPWFQ